MKTNQTPNIQQDLTNRLMTMAELEQKGAKHAQNFNKYSIPENVTVFEQGDNYLFFEQKDPMKHGGTTVYSFDIAISKSELEYN